MSLKKIFPILFALFLAITLPGCGTTVTPASIPPTVEPAPTEELPLITTVTLDKNSLPKYNSLEMTVDLEAEYANPFDAREVQLNGNFTAPDGSSMFVPGFWDGEASWKIRFTPSQEGEWHYQLAVTDVNGISPFFEGAFSVTASENHGWLQTGQWVNPDYSPRYLVHHDGTPFYGAGYCEALNILIDGFSAENGVGLFNDMNEAGANYVVWWPLYSMSPIKSNYDKYSASDLLIMDTIVADAQKKGIYLVFTIWDHPELRDKTHSWGDGRWEMNNGFRKLGDIDSFFTSDDAWAWQENFYRYLIARYGYSPAIGLWQTASEINGTNAYENSDGWIAKVNYLFCGK